MRVLSNNRRDITNPDFYLLMQRLQRREAEAKMLKLQPQDTKPERTSKWREIVKAILGIIAVYITIMVLVGVMR